MKMIPRKPTAGMVRLLDAIHPFAIILSVVGLVLEYSPAHSFVALPNKVIDLFFVFDFAVRLISYPVGTYLFANYGWIDFLACIPGLTMGFFPLPLFRFFRIVRIGRFFKFVRVLRFFLIFSFIKKMKDDSVFIQERLMKVAASVVLVFVVGLCVFDVLLKSILNENESALYREKYENAAQNLDSLMQNDSNIVLLYKNGTIRTQNGEYIRENRAYSAIVNTDSRYLIEIDFDGDYVYAEGMIWVPKCGILLNAPEVQSQYNRLMCMLVLTLILVLITLIFYVGSVFASDMRKVQLIIDSIDADDYMLLGSEVRKYRIAGEYRVDEDRDELDNLISMLGKVIKNNHLDKGSVIMSVNLSPKTASLAANADDGEGLSKSDDVFTLKEDDFSMLAESHATLASAADEDDVFAFDDEKETEVAPFATDVTDSAESIEDLDIPDVAELDAEAADLEDTASAEDSVDSVFSESVGEVTSVAAEEHDATEDPVGAPVPVATEKLADDGEVLSEPNDAFTLKEDDFSMLAESHATLASAADEDEIFAFDDEKETEPAPLTTSSSDSADSIEDLDIPDVAELDAEAADLEDTASAEDSVDSVFAESVGEVTSVAAEELDATEEPVGVNTPATTEKLADDGEGLSKSDDAFTLKEDDFSMLAESHATLASSADEDEIFAFDDEKETESAPLTADSSDSAESIEDLDIPDVAELDAEAADLEDTASAEDSVDSVFSESVGEVTSVAAEELNVAEEPTDVSSPVLVEEHDVVEEPADETAPVVTEKLADDGEGLSKSDDAFTLKEDDFSMLAESHATLASSADEDDVFAFDDEKETEAAPFATDVTDSADSIEDFDIPDVAELDAEVADLEDTASAEDSVNSVFAESVGEATPVVAEEHDVVEETAGETAPVVVEELNVAEEPAVVSAFAVAEELANSGEGLSKSNDVFTLKEDDFSMLAESHATLASSADEDDVFAFDDEKETEAAPFATDVTDSADSIEDLDIPDVAELDAEAADLADTAAAEDSVNNVFAESVGEVTPAVAEELDAMNTPTAVSAPVAAEEPTTESVSIAPDSVVKPVRRGLLALAEKNTHSK